MTHFLTAEGKKQLEEKLNYYKSTRRVEASEKIAIAREFGDLSENSEYDAAKEEQAQIEAEIHEMEDILLNCEIIDNSATEGQVSIGSTVTVYDEEFDENLVLQILGSTESNPAKGIISNNSPVGAALIGRKVGEKVTVKMEGGDIVYKILEVKHNF
ncbi:MAG: transcription elongation factor GreA [Clostridia bacterium]|jgi:transcription elongation factor GreA|nr:transcription elongation factor GreA [Clostridia bacterium]